MRRYCAAVVDGTEGNPALPCWRTLQAMQRVSAGVAKALLLCVVTKKPKPCSATVDLSEGEEVAMAKAASAVACEGGHADADSHMTGAIAAAGLQVEVLEVSRWAPGQTRQA
jgi:hypothetical protein